MDKIEILYDHYKESNLFVQNASKNRNKYFVYLGLIIFSNLLFLLYPNDFISNIEQLLNNNYNINISNLYIIIQATLWILTTFFLIQYLHKNIYIERQYIYLKNIEKEMCELMNTNVLKREGDSYLKEYPFVLNILDFFYKWIVPLAIISITFFKLYFEYKDNICLFLKIFDTTCFCFVFIVLIFYLKFLHFKNIKIKIHVEKSTND